jgi:SHS2 domain-containing protein
VTLASWELVDGPTGDLSFVARGPTPEAAFEAAAEALLAATVEEPARVGRRERCTVEIAEPVLDLLLLHFLNELVYLRDARRLLLRPIQLRIHREGELLRLDAELRGESIDPDRHRLGLEVKAATAHGLSVVEATGGWEARVTLDV